MVLAMGRRGRRVLLSFVLVASLLSLRSLVLASGIEQTWIPGIYDAGDLDDAFALTSFKALGAPAPPRVDASARVVARVEPAAPDTTLSRAVSTTSSRAPPLA
jgi:hypothetical protein